MKITLHSPQSRLGQIKSHLMFIITFTVISLIAGSFGSRPIQAADEAKSTKAPSTLAPVGASPTTTTVDPVAATFFVENVRTVLIEQCVKCHGGEKIKGDFDLTSRDALLHPGPDGPMVIPGNSKLSRLMVLIRHEDEPHMPEKKDKLADKTIAMIARWIDDGAVYDKPLIAKSTIKRDRAVVTAEDRKFWSFAPLANATAPAVKDENKWVRTPIDQFIKSALEAKQIEPNPIASKRKLIRRLYLDLLGLPPTPEQIDQFLSDKSTDAYEKLVDQVLANPHFGERQARHWLDVARYGESHGYEQDYDRHYAYHYRDFCIRAFNDDMPFDQFVKWQLAGDEMAPDNAEALAATGFLAAGMHATQITANQAEKERYDELDDMANTTGTAFLGMTVGCARCHDHKFDPIPAKDYYQLLSTFTTTVRAVVIRDPKQEFPVLKTAGPNGLYATTNPSTPYMMIASEGVPAIRNHTQGPDFYPKTFFCKRGDVNQKDGEVSQGFLSVLVNCDDADTRWKPIGQSAAGRIILDPPTGEPKKVKKTASDAVVKPATTKPLTAKAIQVKPVERAAPLSYRRSALANWISDTQKGAGHLMARVIVNRIWQHHFGKGLVSTPNDFGVQGEKPTHPLLLDYLANQLIANQWHLKSIHKLILTSSVYMQDNQYDPRRNAVDPDNQLLWRRPLIRLEAECIRDSMLSVSGQLDDTMYGPGTLDEAMKRRSIYFFIKRSRIIPMMLLFDAPNSLTAMGSRAVTTVAPQALAMMNNPQIQSYARSLAKKLDGSTPTEKVTKGYLLALGRKPDAAELSDTISFMADQQQQYTATGRSDASDQVIIDFCQSLLSLSEFIYVE